MVICGFLQNQWFKDAERAKKMLAKWSADPKLGRERFIKTFLFYRCLTGDRLEMAFGEDRCSKIVWEEASPQIGSVSQSLFPPDYMHIAEVLAKHKPDVVLTFGTVASQVLSKMLEEFPTGCEQIAGPHPAARFKGVVDELKAMAAQLETLERKMVRA